MPTTKKTDEVGAKTEPAHESNYFLPFQLKHPWDQVTQAGHYGVQLHASIYNPNDVPERCQPWEIRSGSILTIPTGALLFTELPQIRDHGYLAHFRLSDTLLGRGCRLQHIYQVDLEIRAIVHNIGAGARILIDNGDPILIVEISKMVPIEFEITP